MGTFTISLDEASSETGLFRYLCDYIFGLRNFKNTKSMTVNFFSKSLNLFLDFGNVAKNWEKVFWFLDNCIWIGINKVSLLRRGYLPWAANVLTSSPTILHVNKRYFLQLNWLGGDQEYHKSDVMLISTVLGHVDRVPCRRIL